MKSTADLFTVLVLAALIGCSGSDADQSGEVAPGDPGAVAGQPAAGTPGATSTELVELPASEPVQMRCGNMEVTSRYIASPPSVELNLGDSMAVLPQAVSASGARYANQNETVVWWNKGDSATLTRRGQSWSCGPLPPLD